MENALRGTLCFKGERGYSAYEIAVQNGFIGSMQDWLATLGTSSHFKEESVIHTSTANQTSFALPSNYTSNSFIDVYVNGLRLNSNEFTINTSAKTINLNGVVLTAGQAVEIVVLTMSTNALPIVTTINSEAEDDTAPSTKSVYNYVEGKAETLNNSITAANNAITAANNSINTVKTTVSTLSTNTTNSLAKKVNVSDFAVLTGNISNIAAGGTKQTDISYPNGFTQSNTVIISKMVSTNNNYYEVLDLEDTASGFPVISKIALIDGGIRVWLKNTNASTAMNGYFKIAIMKTA